MVTIKIDKLSFAYNDNKKVLDDLSLIIKGEPTAIIGQNGAGKTTLVKLLKGLITQTEGTITIDDLIVAQTNVADTARKVGLVFQNPDDQIFNSTVLEEVMFGPLNIGMSPTAAEKAAKFSLNEVGLIDKITSNPFELSLSDRKLIAIASITAMQTDVVIFDEPTIGQDRKGKMLIKQIIERLHQEGKLVITIIHDMDFVATTFPQTIVLVQGRVLISADTRKVFEQLSLLEKAKLAQPHITQLGKELGLEETVLSVEEFVKQLKPNF
jgi:ABC-type cobalt transport system, ATPase component